MELISLSDILLKAGFDLTKVKLIRHVLSSNNFRECYEKGFVKEYTQLQDNNFSKGYDYWIVFVSDGGTSCRLDSCYKVNGAVTNSADLAPKEYPHPEDFNGERSYFDLEKLDILAELEGRLVIDWGKATRSWHQRISPEKDKPVIALQANQKKEFKGFEDLVVSYNELKDIVKDAITYEDWHAALSSVNAVYLIVDTVSGKQYVGSAYGKDGLLGRWSIYVETTHGNNKLMKETVCKYPDRYKYFQFSVLQILPKNMSDDEIIHTESQWKKKLMTKEFGMNDN